MGRDRRDRAECILCGKCLSACPLLDATGREELAPRAKARLAARLLDRPGTLDETRAARLASLCLGCGRCAEACGQGLDPAEEVSRLRAAHPGWREWLWKQWITRAETLWPRARQAAGLAASLPGRLHRAGPKRLGAMLKSLRGLDRPVPDAYVQVAAFPDPATLPLDADLLSGREALLFSGCAGRFLRPQWERKAAGLLAGLGLRRIGADFACCGATLGCSGLLREQRAAQRRNVDIWRAAGRPLLTAYCASCVRGLADYAHAPELFENGDEAALWSARLMPLSRLLKSARFVVSESAPAAAGYHRPCHQAGTDHDRLLLEAALGERLLPLPDRCCGFGGTLRLAAPDLADRVAARRAADLCGPEQVLTGCTACALQLAASAPETTTTGHWLDIFS